MSDIFISYSRKDLPKVRLLADALNNKGWTIWWDPKIRSGEAFDRVIETALAAAKCVIVVWSKNSVKSDWVRAEASDGLERKILVSVAIEQNVKLPLRFSQIHTENLFDWSNNKVSSKFEKVVSDISVVLGHPPNAILKTQTERSEGYAEKKLKLGKGSLDPNHKEWKVELVTYTETKKTFKVCLGRKNYTVEIRFNRLYNYNYTLVLVDGELVAKTGLLLLGSNIKLDFYLSDGVDKFTAMVEGKTSSGTLEEVRISIDGQLFYE